MVDTKIAPSLRQFEKSIWTRAEEIWGAGDEDSSRFPPPFVYEQLEKMRAERSDLKERLNLTVKKSPCVTKPPTRVEYN